MAPTRFAASVLVLVFAVVGTTSADISPPVTGYQVNVTTTGTQQLSDVTAGSAGRFVVVWESDENSSRTDGSYEGIEHRLLPDGQEVQVNQYTVDVQESAAVASDAGALEHVLRHAATAGRTRRTEPA